MNLFKKSMNHDEVEQEKKALHLEIEMNFGSLTDLGKSYYSNLYSNLFHLSTCYNLKPCHQSMKNVPAIICGAGESLENNFSLLKTLSSQALVFATGTAMPIMAQNSIPYHFGFGIDPHSPKRMQDHLWPVPLICTTSYAKENFSTYPYPKILVGGINELPWEEKINEDLGLSLAKLDYGYNVTTLAVAAAHFLGCSPIVLVGVDLCYRKKKYSGQIKDKNTYETSPAIDIQNKKVLTQKDWLLVKIWLERFQEQNLVPLINASNGLKLEKISNESLNSISFGPLKTETLVNQILLQCSKIQLTKNTLTSFFSSHYSDLLKIHALIEELDKKNELIQMNFNLLETIPFYESFFNPFWTIFQTSFASLKPQTLSEQEKIIHEKAQKIAFLKTILQTHIPLLKKYL